METQLNDTGSNDLGMITHLSLLKNLPTQKTHQESNVIYAVQQLTMFNDPEDYRANIEEVLFDWLASESSHDDELRKTIICHFKNLISFLDTLSCIDKPN